VIRIILILLVFSSTLLSQNQQLSISIKPIIREGKYYGAEAVTIFDVPLDTVWNVLTNYEADPEYCYYTKESKVIYKDENKATVFKKMKFFFIPFDIILDFNEDFLNKRLGWRQTKGFFRKNEGYWEVSLVDSMKTKIKYYVEIEHILITDGMAKRLLNKNIPEMLALVEKRTKSAIK
jgi:hypothetical protein